MFSRCAQSADPPAIATGAILCPACARSPKDADFRGPEIRVPSKERHANIEGNVMSKLLLNDIAGIAGETIKLLILMVAGIVLLDRVKNAARQLNARVAELEDWRDEHISSIQPHTVCILEERRKVDEREWLERIERKIDRLEERIDALTEKIHA